MKDRSALSYKDPHGYVYTKDDRYLRYVDLSYRKHYDHLLSSGLYRVLAAEQLITPFTEITNVEITGAYKILLPEQLDFISYPYEWCFEQWLACVKVFFTINNLCLQHGMILKDATPFNFCQQDGVFKMFDILSFEFYKEGDPWVAYRQFCENFLGPISLMNYNYPQWGQLFSSSLNGFKLSFVNKNLPLKTYFNPTCLLHIHLHSMVRNKQTRHIKEAYFKKEQLIQLWRGIDNGIKKWRLKSAAISSWIDYYDKDIQTQNYLTLKETTVDSWMKNLHPASVIDVGANTGKFSVIAAKYAKKVIAIESDHYSLNNLYQLSKVYKNINAVLADLANPSAGLGWDNKEKLSLISRITGHTVLALAIIHHLRITYNVPILLIAQLFHQIAEKYLVLEFVGKGDEKVKGMLFHREDIYTDYTEKNVKVIFGRFFCLREEVVLLEQERVIFLWEKR